MTIKDFNEKYKDFLEENHYGLAISYPEAIQYLDKKFEEFIKTPNFKYAQIKIKFGIGVFYCDNLPDEEVKEVQDTLTSISKKYYP